MLLVSKASDSKFPGVAFQSFRKPRRKSRLAPFPCIRQPIRATFDQSRATTQLAPPAMLAILRHVGLPDRPLPPLQDP